MLRRGVLALEGRKIARNYPAIKAITAIIRLGGERKAEDGRTQIMIAARLFPVALPILSPRRIFL